MGRQALGQIFEWGQFLDLLIHIAGARTVDKHHGGHRCGDVLRQGQQTVEGVMGAFTNNDGFLFHNRSSFLLLAEPPGIHNGNAHQDAQYYRQHPRKRCARQEGAQQQQQTARHPQFSRQPMGGVPVFLV